MQKTVPAGAQAPKAVAEAGRLIDEARAGLAKVGTATEVKAAAEDLRQAKQTVRKARRALELAAKGQAAPQGL
jgi:hypothetical protein